MTNPFFRRPPSSIAEFLAIALLTVTLPACAVSRKYDGEVNVTLRDGLPCFYANDPKLVSRSGPQWWDVSVSTSRYEAQFNAVWVAGIKAPLPVAPSNCVPYGAQFPTAKVRMPAATLPNGMLAYEVFLGVGPEGSHPGGRYGLRFCYGADANDKPALRRWDSVSLRCTPESPETKSGAAK